MRNTYVRTENNSAGLHLQEVLKLFNEEIRLLLQLLHLPLSVLLVVLIVLFSFLILFIISHFLTVFVLLRTQFCGMFSFG